MGDTKAEIMRVLPKENCGALTRLQLLRVRTGVLRHSPVGAARLGLRARVPPSAPEQEKARFSGPFVLRANRGLTRPSSHHLDRQATSPSLPDTPPADHHAASPLGARSEISPFRPSFAEEEADELVV